MIVDVPPPTADPVQAAAVRDLLRRAEYTRDGIQAAIGVSGDVLARSQDRPVYLRRLRGNGLRETLIRLFLLDQPVNRGDVERAIAPLPLSTLESLGVIATFDGQIRGLVRIVPHGELVLASDLPDREDDSDHVAGLHRPSVTLADLTVRRPVRTALDVGTGFGIQALLISKHAERVVATDINERALAFARLNAAMNGVTNVEFRAGSFFEPVAGERFDLVVCNPPYVISPESEYLFRDSGLGRDRVSEQLVGQLPGFLEEGGFGTIMVSWIQSGDDPAGRPRAWLEGSGCDAWVLHTAIEDPLTAAAGWNRELASDEARYAEAVDRWTDYFRSEAIEAVAYGSIIVRRRTPTAARPNWVRSRQLPNEPRLHPEAHVLRLFAGPDRSGELPDDAAFAAEPLSMADGVEITSHLRHGPDGWAEAAVLSAYEGIPFSFDLDRFLAGFLGRLDGSRPLGEALGLFAAEHNAPPDRVRASGIRIARELLEVGLAVPSRGGNGTWVG